MRAVIVRTGAQASKYKVTDLSWRQAFYDSAIVAAEAGTLVGPVQVVVRPHCVDARGVAEVWSCREAVDQALEAAVAAKLLGDRRDVCEVTVHRFQATGVDGMTVEFRDAGEPF